MLAALAPPCRSGAKITVSLDNGSVKLIPEVSPASQSYWPS